MTSALGSMFLAALLAAPPPPPTVDAADPPPVPAPAPEPEPEPTVGVPPPVEPQQGALEHLDRAQQLEAAGELEAAEAEVSAAIASQPDDAPPYLARAQIRVALADRSLGDDAAARRARARLLRLAAEDLATYVEHATLASDGVAWFRAREQALVRDAEALEPTELVGPAEPTEPAPTGASPGLDDPPRSHAGAWIGSGAIAAATGVGLMTAGLRIEQRCPPDAACTARWSPRAELLAPATVLAALGTASLAIGLAKAPALERAGPRRAVIASGLALGATAAVLGTILGAFTGVRWAVVSPADDAALGTTQTLGNTAAASFTAAVPLLGAGLTASIRARLARPAGRMARLR